MTHKMQSWGELTDEVHHEYATVESALEAAMRGAIHKAQQKPQFYHKDFYLLPMLRVNMIERAPEDMNLYIVPVLVHGQRLKAACIFRESIPTPVYEQSVFLYHHQSMSWEFMWNIPIKSKHQEYIQNYMQYIKDPEQRRQADMCMMFESGQLLEWVKKENKEDPKFEGYYLQYNNPQTEAIIQ